MKPKPIIVFLSVFLLIVAISALIGWMGGYDFDRRNEAVGVWTLFTIMAATIIAGFISSEIK